MQINLIAFRSRIEGKKVLNFKSTDFSSMAYKDTVQDILRTTYFPAFDLKTLSSTFQVNQFKSVINKLSREYPDSYQDLFKFTVGGNFGPGELISYFATSKGLLSGRLKTGDLTVGGTIIEVKSSRLDTSGNFAYDVRTGKIPDTTTSNLIYTKLRDLAAKNNISITGDIKAETISQLRKLGGDDFTAIEKIYSNAVSNEYFNKFTTAIFNDRTSALVDVFSPRTISPDDIKLYRYSQRQFSGSIRIK